MMNYYIGNIYEYDVKSCAYNILTKDIVKYDIVDYKKILEVKKNRFNKLKRNILIGKIQREYKDTKALFTKYYDEIKSRFAIANCIDEKDILFKTKDSLIITKNVDVLDIDGYEFILKNEYEYMFKIKVNHRNIMIFYSMNSQNISIKGLTKFVDEDNGLTKQLINLLNLYFNEKSLKSFFINTKRLRSYILHNFVDIIEPNDKLIIDLGNIGIKTNKKNIAKHYEQYVVKEQFFEIFDSFANQLFKIKE